MAISIVRLGSARARGEGLRVGTVRRPPRGVPKPEWASRNYFDVWLPMLAPSTELVAWAMANTTAPRWRERFRKRYLAEMARPDSARLLDFIAALSATTDLSLGCYCEDESLCHRQFLRELLTARGAQVQET